VKFILFSKWEYAVKQLVLDTKLNSETSRIRFLMESWEFSVDLTLPTAVLPWG
jgi:hypothetical protein